MCSFLFFSGVLIQSHPEKGSSKIVDGSLFFLNQGLVLSEKNELIPMEIV